MKSIADALRRERMAAAAAQSPSERLKVALQLGDADVQTFARARNIDRTEARKLLARQRQHGRAPSRCHESLFA